MTETPKSAPAPDDGERRWVEKIRKTDLFKKMTAGWFPPRKPRG